MSFRMASPCLAAACLITSILAGSPSADIILDCGDDPVHNPDWPEATTVHISFSKCYDPATKDAQAQNDADQQLNAETTGVYACPGCEPPETGCIKDATYLWFGQGHCTVVETGGSPPCVFPKRRYQVDCTQAFKWAVSCTACS